MLGCQIENAIDHARTREFAQVDECFTRLRLR